MKKKMKKLVIHRETLRNLDQLLEQVEGGATVSCPSCPQVCTWSGRQTCATCQLTCTTNFC